MAQLFEWTGWRLFQVKQYKLSDIPEVFLTTLGGRTHHGLQWRTSQLPVMYWTAGSSEEFIFVSPLLYMETESLITAHFHSI